MKNKPSVTLAVSAYNEEKNIINFLKSVLAQKELDYVLESIWVFSDGSTDKTVKYARFLKSKKVKIYDFKKRLGKSSRLNQIYSRLGSDILVQTDADVIFAHPYVIYDIIQPLLKNKKVGMCGGNPLPVKAETFTEKAVNCTVYSFLPFRNSLRGGNNIYSVDGRLLAYKKVLVKHMHIPKDMIANDAYTYFLCLTKGYLYKFIENAVVYYRSPQTINDQIKQCTRFKAARLRMFKYFPKGLVEKEQYIPGKLLYKNRLIQFVKYPIHCSFIFLINKFCKYQAINNEYRLNAKWDMAYSSKSII